MQSEILEKIAQIDEVASQSGAETPKGTPPVVTYSQQAVMLASATIYECTIWAGSTLGGMQRKRHMAAAATEWTKHTADLGLDSTPSTWIHATLLSISQKA